jgi:hypothetical protein
LAAGDDFAVLFHGDAFSGKLHRFEKPRHVRTGLDTLDLSVDGELDHLETPDCEMKVILPRGAAPVAGRPVG